MIADDLRRQADDFVDLVDLLRDYGRDRAPAAGPSVRTFDRDERA